MTRKIQCRSEPVPEWVEIPVLVKVQVECFDDSTERWAIQHRSLGTFFGATKNEALAELFNSHPLR